MTLGALFFAACGVFMGREAATNESGLTLNGVIEFSPRGATVFYWVLAGGSSLFVAAGLAGAVSGLVNPQQLSLTETELSVPRSAFARRPTVVALADVQGLELQQVQREHFLHVHYRDGKLTIHRSFLPDAAAFDAVCEALATRAPR